MLSYDGGTSPCCYAPLTYERDAGFLRCPACRRCYVARSRVEATISGALPKAKRERP